jgi:hypothetical protein
MSPREWLELAWVPRSASANVASLRAIMTIATALALVFLQRTASASDAIDLGQRYPATLDYSPTQTTSGV